MASSQDYSSSPDDARMDVDLEVRSEEDVGHTDGGSQNELDFGSQYSPTNPTENSPEDSFHIGRSGTPNRYSPTSPTDDIDYLEDIVSRTDRSEPDDNSVPEQDAGGSAEDNPVGVLEVDDDDDNDDSDAENRLVIQEEPGEEGEEKEEAGEEEKGDGAAQNQERSDAEGRDKLGEEEGDETSHGQASSQEPASQFEMTDTFLDNANPQDYSQEAGDRALEEEEGEERSDEEQTEQISGGGDASVAREKEETASPREDREEVSALQGKEDAALPREEEEESCPVEEGKAEAASPREEEEGEVREESSSPGLQSPASEPGDNQGKYHHFAFIFHVSIIIHILLSVSFGLFSTCRYLKMTVGLLLPYFWKILKLLLP